MVTILLVSIVTGSATGFALFFRLGYILAAVLTVSFLWNWYSVRSLEILIDRRTKRVSVGDFLEERLTVRNKGVFAKPILEIEDLTAIPGYSTGMAVSLSGKSFRSWRVRDVARKRGIYEFGPVKITSTDMLSLFRRESFYGDIDSVYVYPKIYEIPRLLSYTSYLSGESSERRRSFDLTPYVSNVREYSYGDSLSRIHWPSTARTGKLMSKAFDVTESNEVWVLLDLDQSVQVGELEESSDEYAVSIAASLVNKYVMLGFSVGLICHGDQRYVLPPAAGASQSYRVLELLAAITSSGASPLHTVISREERQWVSNSTLIVVTPSGEREWVTALKQVADRGISVAVVLLNGPTFGGKYDTLKVMQGLIEIGVNPYVVSSKENIPDALKTPYDTGAFTSSKMRKVT